MIKTYLDLGLTYEQCQIRDPINIDNTSNKM